MRDQSTTAPTRVIVLDLVSFVLLATAAGLAIGVTLAGLALLFAGQTAHADVPAVPPAGSVIERPVERPANNPHLPDAPAQPAGQPTRTMV